MKICISSSFRADVCATSSSNSLNVDEVWACIPVKILYISRNTVHSFYPSHMISCSFRLVLLSHPVIVSHWYNDLNAHKSTYHVVRVLYYCHTHPSCHIDIPTGCPFRPAISPHTLSSLCETSLTCVLSMTWNYLFFFFFGWLLLPLPTPYFFIYRLIKYFRFTFLQFYVLTLFSMYVYMNVCMYVCIRYQVEMRYS